MDTSESLRNLQQEIESLLAPLTPLPDLDQVECGNQDPPRLGTVQVPKVSRGHVGELKPAGEESSSSFDLVGFRLSPHSDSFLQQLNVRKTNTV